MDPSKTDMAVSRNWGSVLVGVLTIRALLLVVYVGVLETPIW